MDVFICTNDEQLIGAKVSKFLLISSNYFKEHEIKIINEKDFEVLNLLKGKKFLRSNKIRIYDPNDMQNFTLLRFAVPELLEYKNNALVIDPDIFFIGGDPLAKIKYIEECDLLCRSGNNSGTHATSLMFLNCANLRSWRLEKIVEGLLDHTIDYNDLINLKNTSLRIKKLDKKWNDFDSLDHETIFLHTTQKVTQPWRKGLPLNSFIPPIFGFIQRDLIYKIFKKPLRIGVDHPKREVSEFFFRSLNEAIKNNFISRNEMLRFIDKGYVRQDIFNILDKLPIN